MSSLNLIVQVVSTDRADDVFPILFIRHRVLEEERIYRSTECKTAEAIACSITVLFM